jgi:signal transduction histidine kinase
MMGIALSNTDRLIRLVNDMLDLERIGSGQEALHTRVCEVEDLMRGAVASLEVDAAAAGLSVKVEAEGVKVFADPDRMLQTLINLLSNAIKFSPPGREVRLCARVAGDEALLQVRDFGRGIPEDKLEAIFERFQQVDATDARSKGGTGLGLAICRSIVAQHGGRIWATSVLGEGSLFSIALPAHAA